MDEILFRSSQRLENFQVQLSLAANYSKDFFQQYSHQSKNAILQAWNGPRIIHMKENVRELWQYIINVGQRLKDEVWLRLDPQQLYYNLVKVFWQKWTRRDLCFMCAGFICGSIVGAVVILSIKKKDHVIRYMQAVQCTNYLGVEGAIVVENARAPDTCGEDDVIITVKAASIHVVDAQICKGYGKNLRRILQRLYNKRKSSRNGLPVTLGRDCTGIITDIGSNAKRLEIGDEVWLTVPFWYEGTISQSVIVPEYRISRKPKNVGFEGACSLPYAGSLALGALKQMDVCQDNVQNKKILIIGGCTPVGCVLIQVLKHWKASVTATCTKRATPVAKALGAAEIITSPESSQNVLTITSEPAQETINTLKKELELREKFDFIIITTAKSPISPDKLQYYCNGKIVSTLPVKKRSDSCGFFGSFVVAGWIYTKYLFEKLLGRPMNDFDEAHLCYVTLDELAEMVESGLLQTVVDKVFHPQDIEIALNHIQSDDSIGSSVITFR